ncbi:MAG: PglZ domain-containing protein [Eubacteriales bacterium]
MTLLNDWIKDKLETVRDYDHVLVKDPFGLLNKADRLIDQFGSEAAYVVVTGATNLAFRMCYETVVESGAQRIMVVDRTPLNRLRNISANTAPPVFYPDFLTTVPDDARVNLDVRQFLRDITADPEWPSLCNDQGYARLIVTHLDGVVRAHKNLRRAKPQGFTDFDFKTIIAFAALGLPDLAFKKLRSEDYWRIGLLGHQTMKDLDQLTGEVLKPIKQQLLQAPAPFGWFVDQDAEMVVRGFYLSTILAQHTGNWKLLLANIDPALSRFAQVEERVLTETTPRLIKLDPRQAERDVLEVEGSLDQDDLALLLLDQLHVDTPAGFISVLEKEKYSNLFRSLALLMALDDCLSEKPSPDTIKRLKELLYNSNQIDCFTDCWHSESRTRLSEAFKLAVEIYYLRRQLSAMVRNITVKKPEQLTFTYYWQQWNQKKLNRLEYYLSLLERLLDTSDLLPRRDTDLPELFARTLSRVRKRVRALSDEVHYQLNKVNKNFQDLVALQYPRWIAGKDDVVLTSQFIIRCLKPHWDPQNEKAVIFIFDGMRYDIWEELLYPALAEKLELLQDYPAVSILPTETHLTRKAISAGTFPDHFDSKSGEDKLLKEGLGREMGIQREVEVINPEGHGTGETVHYRCGNLDVYIFELCDKELHGIHVKTLGDGREAPARPLAFIYQQLIKNILDLEVMAIMRTLEPGTKVFITADHGFVRLGRQPIWFDDGDLNEQLDCSYQNTMLKVTFNRVNLKKELRVNMIAFSPQELRVPSRSTRFVKAKGQLIEKEYRSIVFPRPGYSFKRQGSPYNPDAYSHGGISLQEMIIPMVVMRVKADTDSLIIAGPLTGPAEVLEGEELEVRVQLEYKAPVLFGAEMRVDVDAYYGPIPGKNPAEQVELAHQVVYVGAKNGEIIYRFRPRADDASKEERIDGVMKRLLTIELKYKDGMRTVRQSLSRGFLVKLNSEQVIRRGVPTHLGNILGLTPKNMR